MRCVAGDTDLFYRVQTSLLLEVHFWKKRSVSQATYLIWCITYNKSVSVWFPCNVSLCYIKILTVHYRVWWLWRVHQEAGQLLPHSLWLGDEGGWKSGLSGGGRRSAGVQHYAWERCHTVCVRLASRLGERGERGKDRSLLQGFP